MILSGQAIRRWCKAERLVSPFAERTEVDAGSGRKMTFGLGPAGYDVRVEFDAEGKVGGIDLRPGGFLLASTIERFSMPNRLLAEVKDKSSWARRGLAVQNTVIEPGWRGWLTLELTNHGSETLSIVRGMPIAQIIFHVVSEEVELPYEAGKYQDQGRGPRKAR